MVRLRRVSRDELTIARRRRGTGFSYADAEGAPIRDAATRGRIGALGIPPAWTEVAISPLANAHIQATGYDAAGRLQYIYHPDWERRRAGHKLERLALLGDALPRIRRRVSRDLMAEAGSSALAQAIAVALIDRTAMRVGRERYLTLNGTRGAGTLYARDVQVDGAVVTIAFPAKGGKAASYSFTDRRLADAIARIKALPGRRLLVHRGVDGRLRALNTEAINAYLSEIAGARLSAKDFRTLHASALAAEALAGIEPATSMTARRRQVAGVTREVAEFLRNTPTICRQSYIAPCLFTLFDSGSLQALWAECVTPGRGRKLRERRLAAVLAAAN